MKRIFYRINVYLTILISAVCLFFFVFEMKEANGFNAYAILCLILSILGLILFVLNQILYRQFKKRDASRYEEVECPHCHTMNPKKEIFCKKCGRNLYCSNYAY